MGVQNGLEIRYDWWASINDPHIGATLEAPAMPLDL